MCGTTPWVAAPLHPLLLFDEANSEVNKDFSNCQVCKEKRWEYCYGCFRCNFKLHIRCGSLVPTTEAPEVLHHPLTPYWKWMTFTCDLCAKDSKSYGTITPSTSSILLNSINPTPIMSTLFSKTRHKLWPLLLLQMRFRCPPRLCYERGKHGGHKFAGT